MKLNELKVVKEPKVDMGNIYDLIKIQVAAGNKVLVFKPNMSSYNVPHTLNSAQVDILRENGYTVNFDSVCERWTVSGW